MNILRLSLVVAAVLSVPVVGGAQAHDMNASADCAKTSSATMDHASMDHATHQATMRDCAEKPKLPAQAAYGAIAEIVRILEADSTTDWAKVNIEALRQHLIDMDDVTLRSSVAQHSVAGGAEMDVTGTGRTVGAIQRMVVDHSRMLDQLADYHAVATRINGGVHLIVTARIASDARVVARIRGLGFAGLLTEGDHHSAHHLALARGDAHPHRE